MLVSDGEETCGDDPCATARRLHDRGVDLEVDVVGLHVGGRARDQLRCIARRGHGSYRDAGDADELADALGSLTTRALRPFRLQGTPVSGSTSAAAAPVVGAGGYVDRFAADPAALHYRVRRSRHGSTLHVGFTAYPGHAPPFPVGVALRLLDTDGDECGLGTGSVIGLGAPLLTAEVQPDGQGTPGCDDQAELVLQVRPQSQDLGKTPFELLVVEEPPVADGQHLPTPPRSVHWQRMRPARTATAAPVAGDSLSSAPTLAPGTYRASIVPGEAQVYAVPADWGQRVQVQVVVGPRQGALREAFGLSSELELQLLGAVRGEYELVPVDRDLRGDGDLADPDWTVRLERTTAPVTYRSREPGELAWPASVPGPQYVVLTLAGRPRDRPLLVPYTLVVSVIGTPGTGAPRYVTASSGPAPTPEATPVPSPGSPAPPSSSSPESAPEPATSPRSPLAIAVGVLALAAAAALALRHLRRGSRRG